MEIKAAKPKAKEVTIQESSEFRTTSPLQPSQPLQAKDKGKGIMVELEKSLKKKDQKALDEEIFHMVYPGSQGYDVSKSGTKSTNTSDGLAAIQAQLNNLGREIKKVNDRLYAAQVRCRAAALGFYQRDNGNPSYQERRQIIEESLSKLMAESAKRHDENSNLIKEIRASTDVAIKNQRASIKALKNLNRAIEQALADLGAGVSVMPYSTFTNLGLGELAPTKLIIELADTTIRCPKGIEENVLVGIDKFVFPVDFIVLATPEDIKVLLILRRPFLSTTHVKIYVFKKNVSLRVWDDRIIFISDNPTSNKIRTVYALGLRERMKLDLEAGLMGEYLILNRSLDHVYGDYIVLNDLNEPLELRRNQVEDLGPTIEDGEIINEPIEDIVKTRNDDNETNAYHDKRMGDVIVGKSFCREVGVIERRLIAQTLMHLVSSTFEVITIAMIKEDRASYLAYENLGNLQPKVDIGIFIGYAPTKKAFRIYNRRTRRSVETIHVGFDELTAMASEQSSSGPVLHEIPSTISSGLVPKSTSSTPFVPPSIND
uniref:Retroviral polymerase SH3-like domain-containing protein n=1 Tax=Tanacetum cinerariifolium TaxID=118510 RepID=A0A6L2JS54_TANCI|nr:hypothetical protein [Tanacetum cinerariifolium]